jgi:hypothetical protein
VIYALGYHKLVIFTPRYEISCTVMITPSV